MEALADSLKTVRRTHFVLVLLAIGIFALSVPAGPDYNGALKELATLRQVMGDDVIGASCAGLAQQDYEFLLEMLITANEASATPVPISDDARVGGWVDCYRPSQGDPLDSYAQFLLGTQRVRLAAPQDFLDAVPVGQLGDGDELTGIFVAAGAMTEDVLISRVVSRDDTLAVQFLDSPLGPRLTKEEAQARASMRATFTDLDSPGSTTTFANDIDIGVMTRSTGRPRFEWLADTELGVEGVVSVDASGPIALPGLQPFWEAVGTLSPGDAFRYLSGRADEGERTVEVFGINLTADLLGWAGPFLLLMVLAYLLVQLGHLVRIVDDRRATLAEYPWVGLFQDRLSRSAVWVSVVLVPGVAALAVAMRVAAASPLAASWAAVTAVGCVVLGTRVMRALEPLRSTERTPPPTTPDSLLDREA